MPTLRSQPARAFSAQDAATTQFLTVLKSETALTDGELFVLVSSTITRGEGPMGFRVGRHVRSQRRDVEAWIDGKVREGKT